MQTADRATSRHAFTLTEVAIVLGIIGLILGAIWTAAAKVYANNRVTKSVQQVLTIANGVRGIYGGKGAFQGTYDITQAMVNGGVYPADMIQTSCTGNGAFTGNASSPSPCPMDVWNGGAVQVGTEISWWYSPAGPSNFTIMFWDPNIKDCAAFVGQLIGSAPSAGIVYIYAAGMTALSSSSNTTPLPSSTPVTAASGCTGYVTIGFTL